jgi:hypothetical protein
MLSRLITGDPDWSAGSPEALDRPSSSRDGASPTTPASPYVGYGGYAPQVPKTDHQLLVGIHFWLKVFVVTWLIMLSVSIVGGTIILMKAHSASSSTSSCGRYSVSSYC